MTALTDLISASGSVLTITRANPKQEGLIKSLGNLVPPLPSELVLSSVSMATPVLKPAAKLRFAQPLKANGVAQPVWGSSTTVFELEIDESGDNAIRLTASRAYDITTQPDLAGLSVLSAIDYVKLECLAPGDSGAFWQHQREIDIEVALSSQRTVTLQLIPRSHEDLLLHAEFEQSPPSLSDFFSLFGHASSATHHAHTDLQELPASLLEGADVSLTSIEARFSAGAQKLTVEHVDATLQFGRNHHWSLIPGFDGLQLSDIYARLSVEQPLNSAERYVWIECGGTLEIQRPKSPPAQLALAVRWPDFAVTGHLLEHHDLPLGALLAQLGVPSLGDQHHEHTLVVSALDFTAEVEQSNRQFSFRAVIDNDWPIEFSPGRELRIKQLMVALAYESDQADGLAVELAAKLELGGHPFTLSAQRQNGGWEFHARSAESAQLHLGQWLKQASKQMTDLTVPQAIADFTILHVELAFHSESRDLNLQLDCKVAVNSRATLRLALKRQADGKFHQSFTGAIYFGDRCFALHFDKGTDSVLVGSYLAGNSDHIRVDELAALAGLSAIPGGGTSFELRSALLAWQSSSTSSLKLASVDLGAGLDLSGLPLLGAALPPAERLALELQITAASQQVDDSSTTQVINAALPRGATPLPESGTPILKKGLNLSTKLIVAGDSLTVGLPLATDKNNAQPVETNNNAAPPTGANAQDDGTHWVKLQKQFGPVSVERAGLRYANSTLSMLVDGSLTAGPLSLALDGLGLSSALHPIKPKFELHGLGLDFSSGPIEIGGALLRTEKTDAISGETYDSFDGAAIVKAKGLSLSALGSYAKLRGQPSLFVYAVLDYPLGGPAFFFVTGLAAGFGYNRSLHMPGLTAVADFPLVKSAVEPASAVKDVAGALEQLDQHVPVDIGQYFMAVGVKFNSFKLIDSFALLAVTFGHQFEVDVLGLSTLTLPSPDLNSAATPIAELQMALKARFAPAEHLLSVEAELTPASFIFSKKCHLRGGFAFYSWFSGPRGGEFVVSLGGYHPQFKSPHYYPKPARLGFSWQVTPAVQIKGDAYCALTGHALMAGGELQATYHEGNLRAWFNAHANFLLNFAPYHYSADMSVHIGASYTYHFLGTHHINAEVGVDLSLHGPEFAGHARVDLAVTHVDFDFGPRHTAANEKLDWPAFSKAFLTTDSLCTSQITQGLLSNSEKKKSTAKAVVNPKHFELSVLCQVPLSNKLDIGPMALSGAQSTLDIQVWFNGKPATKLFSIKQMATKKMPANLWGSSAGSRKPSVNAKRFVKRVAGKTITPAVPPVAGHTRPVDRSVFKFEPLPSATLVPRPKFKALRQLAPTKDLVTDAFAHPNPQAGWEDTAKALGIETGRISIRAGAGNDLLCPPEMVLKH